MPEEIVAAATTEVASQPAAESSAVESSSPDASTPATTEESQAEQVAEAKGFATLEEALADPTFKAEYEKRLKADADKLAQKRIARERKKTIASKADTAIANDDGYQAIEALKEARQLLEEPDEDTPPQLRPDWKQRTDAVRADVQRLWAGSNKELYQRTLAANKAKLDKVWAENPEEYFSTALNKMIEQRATEKAQKDTPAMAQAMATDQVARQLQNLPVPLNGNGAGGGGLTIDRYRQLTPEEAAKLRPEDIDNMWARESRAAN